MCCSQLFWYSSVSTITFGPCNSSLIFLFVLWPSVSRMVRTKLGITISNGVVVMLIFIRPLNKIVNQRNKE